MTKEIKDKRQNQSTYYADLDLMKNIKDDQREMENLEKFGEKQEIEQKIKYATSYKDELVKEDQMFKKAMGQDYIKEMANHKRQLLEEKLRSINEDNAKIKQVAKEGDQEKYFNSLNKARLRSDQDSTLKLKQGLKQQEYQMKLKEQDEYNRMINDNIQKEIKSEENYKKYFEKSENVLSNRLKQHQDFLINNNTRRSHDKNLWEQKYLSEKQKKDDSLYENAIKSKLNNTRQNFDIVKQQLERKQMERAKDAEIQRNSIEQRYILFYKIL